LTTPHKELFRDNETNYPNEHNSIKNPTWWDAAQMAIIYKGGQRVELGATVINSS